MALQAIRRRRPVTVEDAFTEPESLITGVLRVHLARPALLASRFWSFATIQRAVNHLSSPMGESSKMVPALGENCLRHALHFQMCRVEM